MTPIVYFSSASENTKRFVEKLGWPAHRIPLRRGDPDLHINEPYVLILPTYGGGDIAKAVPRQVIHFLNDPANRRWIKGVICSGNTNFGAAYCTAGPTIAQKCHVPELYRFELMGTDFDVLRVQEGLTRFFASPHFNRPPADAEYASLAVPATQTSPAPPDVTDTPDMPDVTDVTDVPNTPNTAITTGREPQTTTSPTGELIA